MKEVIIYTDGACSGNPGPGGYGAILMYKGHKKELSGYAAETTNNRMELTAAIVALKALKEPCKVKLYSDSAYLVNAINNEWIYSWVKHGWKHGKNKKEDVKNSDLWKEIYRLMQTHEIEFIKVKGHSDNEYNNRCDKLATDAIKNAMSNNQK